MNKVTCEENPARVSVIIPTYNCLEFLPRAINSVIDQGIEDYEILVADDNSTDNTWNWLLEQQQVNPRIRPVKLSGVGPSRARNHCISMSYSKYIAFLDADDYWLEDKLKIQLDFMDMHPSMVMSFTDYRHIDMQDKDLGTAFSFWPRFSKITRRGKDFSQLDDALAVIFAENIVGTSTVIAKRNALQNVNGYDESLVSAEDWDLWLKLCQHGEVGYINRVKMDYLMRPDSESSKTNKRIESLKTIVKRYHNTVLQSPGNATLVARARLAVAQAEAFRAEGDYYRAFMQHLKANWLSPNPRTLRALLSDVKNMMNYSSMALR